jgi:hypothetical protein
VNFEPGVLTSMITPAVLISACAALILSTSVRLGRVVDRVRTLSDRFEEMAQKPPGEVELFEDRLGLMFTQLDWLTSRARHLQRALTTFYVALGTFVATSVAIGGASLSGASGARYQWIPVTLGMCGAALLLVGTMLLSFEATLALRAIESEMDFLWKLGRHHAPAPLLERFGTRGIWRQRRKR